jgi:hypothetical protein
MHKFVSTGVVVAVSCVAVTGAVALIADVAEAGGNSGVTGRVHEREQGRVSESEKVGLHVGFGQVGESRVSARENLRPHLRSAAAGDCQTLAPEPWFTVVRRLPDCMGLAIGEHTGQFDVDGNGEPELLARIYYAGSGECAVSEIVYSIVQGEVVATTRCVLDATILVEFAATEVPGEQYCCIAELNFIDVDNDGDLDAVMNLVVDGNRVPCWVENTGFEAAPPRLADINRDGNVDAADLSLLLADWD